MDLNKKTLTKEQKKLLGLGYNIYINDNKKLVTEEPKKPYSKEYIEYKINSIEEQFENSIKAITGNITQEEKNSWTKQEEEARNVLDGGASELLNFLCIEGETVEELANKIILKADYLSLETAKLLQIKRQKLKDLES